MSNLKPANAGAVTRALTAAGMPKASSMASGMVRGWHTHYRGVQSSVLGETKTRSYQVGPQGRRHTKHERWIEPNGKVLVEWQFSSDSDRRLSTEERKATTGQRMHQAREILEAKGYTVVVNEGQYAFTLTVSRTDADGNVVL